LIRQEEKELASGKDQVMNLSNNLTPKGIMDEIIGRKRGMLFEISCLILREVRPRNLREKATLKDNHQRGQGGRSYRKLMTNLRKILDMSRLICSGQG